MKTNKKDIIFYATIATTLVVGVVVDIVTKILFVGVNNGTFIPYVISFQYTENPGAAWGMFAGMRVLLIIFTILILIAFCFYVYKNKHKNKTFLAACSLIFAGAVGNLIDRIFLGYVRDFIRFDFLNYIWNPIFGSNFPICNMADLFLTSGIVVMLVYIIFQLPKLEKKEGENGKKSSDR